MKYIRLNASNVVMEIIPGEDSRFPGIPIEQRYSADFIAALIQTADETEVEQNWVYNPDDQTFSEPPAPEPGPEPEPEPEPVEVARAAKVAEISTACSAAIDAGTSVDLPSGSRESFTYTVADQANVSEMFTACLAGATGYIYHANDAPCKTYPVADIVAIYSTLSMYKTSQLTYHNQLKQYVLTLDDPEAAKAVTYGQELTGTYLERYNTLMAEAQEQMQVVLSKLGGGSDAAGG